jgi:3-deoxy-manno-octulosonate cytidylyltransferase (CMP-KDO synthetase)
MTMNSHGRGKECSSGKKEKGRIREERKIQEDGMVNKNRVLAVIPARYGSSRFPGKVLAKICGRTMIEHVWLRAANADRVDRLVVATDDERISREVERFGGEVVITSPEIRSGSDRVAAVARDIDASVIINIQGDEPLTESATIDCLADFMLENEHVDVGTVVRPVSDPGELKDPNVVKAVLAMDGRVLYFSRSLIPFHADPASLEPRDLGETIFHSHVGIYAYRKEALLRLTSLPVSALEIRESLEQLRALENGMTIYAIIRNVESLGVDHPSQVALVEKLMKKGLNKG